MQRQTRIEGPEEVAELSFTHRERDILLLLVEGHPYKEIAFRLGISPHNVKGRVFEMCRFLGLSGKGELVWWCIRHDTVLRIGRVELSRAPAAVPTGRVA